MEASIFSASHILRKIDGDGFAVVAADFQAGEIEQLQAELCQGLGRPNAAVIQSEGAVVCARNLLELWPAVADVWRRRPLPALLTKILGLQFGLVRALYFDKPPVHTWSLPWHKDLTIAVRDNRQVTNSVTRPSKPACPTSKPRERSWNPC